MIKIIYLILRCFNFFGSPPERPPKRNVLVSRDFLLKLPDAIDVKLSDPRERSEPTLAQATPPKSKKLKHPWLLIKLSMEILDVLIFCWLQKVKTSSSLLIKILIEILDVLTFFGATKIGTRRNVLIKISYVILKCFNFFWWRLSGLSKGNVRISKGIVRISKGIVRISRGTARTSGRKRKDFKKEFPGFQKELQGFQKELEISYQELYGFKKEL